MFAAMCGGDGVEMRQAKLAGARSRRLGGCPWRSGFVLWALGSQGWLLSSRVTQSPEWKLETFLNLGDTVRGWVSVGGAVPQNCALSPASPSGPGPALFSVGCKDSWGECLTVR